jgi:hypothetical protein
VEEAVGAVEVEEVEALVSVWGCVW